jgi:hypothetical protein
VAPAVEAELELCVYTEVIHTGVPHVIVATHVSQWPEGRKGSRMHRRHLILGALALTLVPASAGVAEVKPFDTKAFAAAQEAGQSIVVEVHAPW